MKAGAVNFLTKPVDRDELMAALADTRCCFVQIIRPDDLNEKKSMKKETGKR